MTEILAGLAGIPVGIWVYLFFLRGRFWLERPQSAPVAAPDSWPSVTVIVPARDEAETIDAALESLCAQDYPGPFSILLVDDDSRDATSAQAGAVAARHRDRLTILTGTALPPGWTGKLWAQQQGIAAAERRGDPSRYWFLTDADIVHAPDHLRELVARAESGNLALVSAMAKLNCVSWPEKALIPAYIFFFMMIYPFAYVRDPGHLLAAAAGGAMLVKRQSLKAAGGLAKLRDAIIDDCALARALKPQGGIFLGLTEKASSLRAYRRWGEIRDLIARSAFAQLRYSLAFLGLAALGMIATYLAPVLLTFLPDPILRWFGLAAWAMMAFAYLPILAFYRQAPLWALALPGIAAFYLWATFASARRHVSGQGGQWKGRAQAAASAGKRRSRA